MVMVVRLIIQSIGIVLLLAVSRIHCSSKDKPHGHTGLLEPYNGKPLSMVLTKEQIVQLDKGEAVMLKERAGRSGRGVVVLDVNATSAICMDKIRDLKLYPKMVSTLKSVDIYSTQQFSNGSSRTGAEFKVGMFGIRLGYYLLLTHEPKYNTLTWTLDYKYSSDFDDNVGHWELLPHPSKKGWTRILYSTKIKLFSWIPDFVIQFLTGKALTESTTWVKRESEIEQVRQGPTPAKGLRKPSWFDLKGGASRLKLAVKSKIDAQLADAARRSKMIEDGLQRQSKRFSSYLPCGAMTRKGLSK